MKNKLIAIIGITVLLASYNSATAQNTNDMKMVGTNSGTYAPKYLSVPEFKKCLSTENHGTWKGYCLPSKIIKGCPTASFNELKKLDIPTCNTNNLVKKIQLEPGPVVAINGKPISSNTKSTFDNAKGKDNEQN